MSEVNVDIANVLLEEKILAVLDRAAPMRTVQVLTLYNKWISDDAKKCHGGQG